MSHRDAILCGLAVFFLSMWLRTSYLLGTWRKIATQACDDLKQSQENTSRALAGWKRATALAHEWKAKALGREKP